MWQVENPCDSSCELTTEKIQKWSEHWRSDHPASLVKNPPKKEEEEKYTTNFPPLWCFCPKKLLQFDGRLRAPPSPQHTGRF